MRLLLREDLPLLLPLVLLAAACTGPEGRWLDLPPRPTDALTGSELVEELRGLELEDREARVYQEVALGNVPGWLRRLQPVHMESSLGGDPHRLTFWVTPDYLSIGSDRDFLRIPLSPGGAARVGALSGTALPTTAMVDAIWDAASVRLAPIPIPPDQFMTTVPVFQDHQRKVQRQRDKAGARPGALVAGHKKDVVVTPRLSDHPGHVAIYGWHYLDGEAIQPLYLGHTDDWVDYSHGIRLVHDSVDVNGEMRSLADVLGDPAAGRVLSPEGPF